MEGAVCQTGSRILFYAAETDMYDELNSSPPPEASHTTGDAQSGASPMRVRLFQGGQSRLALIEEDGKPARITFCIPLARTPEPAIEVMMKLASVSRGDVLYDLGSGDGRIAIHAARAFGTRGVGIDLEEEHLKEAAENARIAGVESLLRFERRDLLDVSLREASVVAFFLAPDLNLRLLPKFRRELRPGTRIVSYKYPIGDWPPDKTEMAGAHPVFLWTIREE